MFYVYEWFDVETGEVIYVGKGTNRRYRVRKHNRAFNEYIEQHECDSRIIETFDDESAAFEREFDRVSELKAKGQCICNIRCGGFGGTTSWWTDERKEEYSQNNVMKSQCQRTRMSQNNPMKNPEVAKKTNAKNRRKICIGDKVYESINAAAEEFGVGGTAVGYWLGRGYARNQEPCYYFGEPVPQVVLNKGCYSGKPVIVDNQRFDTVKAAAAYIGTDASILIKCLKANKPCKGHVCRYDNQQPSRTKSSKSNPEGSTTNG